MVNTENLEHVSSECVALFIKMMYLTHLSKSEDDNWLANIKIYRVIRFLQRIQFSAHAQKNTVK